MAPELVSEMGVRALALTGAAASSGYGCQAPSTGSQKTGRPLGGYPPGTGLPAPTTPNGVDSKLTGVICGKKKKEKLIKESIKRKHTVISKRSRSWKRLGMREFTVGSSPRAMQCSRCLFQTSSWYRRMRISSSSWATRSAKSRLRSSLVKLRAQSTSSVRTIRQNRKTGPRDFQA